ncbi:MAG TPA: TonB family protein [Candidatus Baltobacteraceae bacterium]|nr:TonB family protein [Candidatus Baltobacteraceae bacterium]
MSAARARKVLIAAIAISLLIHLLLAGYIRWPFLPPSSETEVVKVRRITVARIAPHTPPPPTPVPTPRPAPAAKPKVIPPVLTARESRGPRVAHVVAPTAAKTPVPAATPLPTPAATPSVQACLAHDISPAVAATPPPVDIPPEARASKVSGTAAIAVQIDAQGHPTNAAVSQSSGNAGLDAVAMQMARNATYTPALVKCKPVASNYTYTVKFVAW